MEEKHSAIKVVLIGAFQIEAERNQTPGIVFSLRKGKENFWHR